MVREQWIESQVNYPEALSDFCCQGNPSCGAIAGSKIFKTIILRRLLSNKQVNMMARNNKPYAACPVSRIIYNAGAKRVSADAVESGGNTD
jgi:hypothetical protein